MTSETDARLTEIGEHDATGVWPRVEVVDASERPRSFTLDECADLPIEQCQPVRDIPHYAGQRHTPGSYWSSTTNGHVAYESNLERCWLTMLDFHRDVVDIASQPLRIVGPVGEEWIDHVPDFFVRLRTGAGCVVDVTHPVRADVVRIVDQAALTDRCVTRAGWDYWRLFEPDEQRWQNISWLSGYRRSLGIDASLADRVLTLAQRPVRIDELATFASHPAVVRPVAFHLMWHHRLQFDIDQPLRDTTLVVAAQED